MNSIANKFLLAEYKFMPEMHLRQSRFTYSACESFTKNKKLIHKFEEKGDWRYIYQSELGKACLQHGIAYGDFEDLIMRKTWDEILRDKAFDIANDPKYDQYQRGIASMVYKIFNEKTAGDAVKNEAMENKELGEKLLKSIIRIFKKRQYCLL